MSLEPGLRKPYWVEEGEGEGAVWMRSPWDWENVGGRLQAPA